MSDPHPPRSPLSPYRAYTAYITPSPKTHALIKAPLSRLARRATDLADTITGGAAANGAEEERRERLDKEKKDTCRACRVVFAGEKELQKHFNLFPGHLELIEARRQGRHRPRHVRHAASASASLGLGQNHHSGSSSHSKRSRSRSRARGSAAAPSASRYVDAVEEFENISPIVATRSAVQSRSGPLRADAPGPLIDYAARNEAQGRDSAARAAEEGQLRRLGQTAHEVKREQDERNGINRRGNGGAAIAQGMRRGLSEGVLTALATMPTRPDPRPSVRQQSFQERTAHLPFTFNPLTGEVDSDDEPQWELESSVNYGQRSALQVAPTMISFRTGYSSQDDPSHHNHTSAPSPATVGQESLYSQSPTQTLVDEAAPVYTANHVGTSRALPPVPAYEPRQSASTGGNSNSFQSLPASGPDEKQDAVSPHYTRSPPSAIDQVVGPSAPAPRPRLRSRKSTNPFREVEQITASPPSPVRYTGTGGIAPDSPTTPLAREASSLDLASPASTTSPYTPRTPCGAGGHTVSSAPYLHERTMSDSPAYRQGRLQRAALVSSPSKAMHPSLSAQNTGAPSRRLNSFHLQARISSSNTGAAESSGFPTTPSQQTMRNSWDVNGGLDSVADLMPPLANLNMVLPPGAPAFPPPPTADERRQRRARHRGTR